MEPESLAEQLRRWIRASKLSQAEIARRSGVQKHAISDFMTDKKDLTLSTASKLAVVVGARFIKPSGRPRKGGEA